MPTQVSAFAILKLPAGSIIGFDGCSVALKRDDFVGFSPIPSDGRFHLITVRAAAIVTDEGNSRGVSRNPSATTAGFAFCSNESLSLVRSFDPITEEVSPEPVDETTASNLLQQIASKQISPERIVSYDQYLSQTYVETWRNLTSFITGRLLQLRNIQLGCKLVAGAFEDDEHGQGTLSQQNNLGEAGKGVVDGVSLHYPGIPVIRSTDGVRYSRHGGTKRFLASLTAAQRTELFTSTRPSSKAIQTLLERSFDGYWEDLLGDLQLSYVVFMNLHCFKSLSHWRDLVAMLSSTDIEGAALYSDMYAGLLKILSDQLKTMDSDLFDDSGHFSDDNFLLQSFRMLLSTLSRVVDKNLSSALVNFRNILIDRFPDQFGEGTMEVDLVQSGDDETDDDAPVVVDSEEIEAALARSNRAHSSVELPHEYSVELRQKYPLLFAAIMQNEDVLMTCARALDEALDVSLVREAAAYLEEVEAQR